MALGVFGFACAGANQNGAKGEASVEMSARPKAPRDEAVNAREAAAIAQEAYIFGYPLVSMEVARRVYTNVTESRVHFAPMGRLAKQRALPIWSYREIPAPQQDTLEVSGWLDLSKGPWVVTVPEVATDFFFFLGPAAGSTYFRPHARARRQLLPKKSPSLGLNT
jgi:hypothetical protein